MPAQLRDDYQPLHPRRVQYIEFLMKMSKTTLVSTGIRYNSIIVPLQSGEDVTYSARNELSSTVGFIEETAVRDWQLKCHYRVFQVAGLCPIARTVLPTTWHTEEAYSGLVLVQIYCINSARSIFREDSRCTCAYMQRLSQRPSNSSSREANSLRATGALQKKSYRYEY